MLLNRDEELKRTESQQKDALTELQRTRDELMKQRQHLADVQRQTEEVLCVCLSLSLSLCHLVLLHVIRIHSHYLFVCSVLCRLFFFVSIWFAISSSDSFSICLSLSMYSPVVSLPYHVRIYVFMSARLSVNVPVDQSLSSWRIGVMSICLCLFLHLLTSPPISLLNKHQMFQHKRREMFSMEEMTNRKKKELQALVMREKGIQEMLSKLDAREKVS